MKRLIVLLDDLLELPDDAARERWLAARPPEQQPLLPALRRMLAAHQAAAPTLDAGAALVAGMASAAGAAPPSSLHAGDRIGRYRLLRELGHGGMSEVWLARPDDDAQADAVALKLPAVSLARVRFLERLARERRILQRLDHPHIARLLDAGVDDTGQQYLALAYVDGAPLTTYCDTHRLGLDARVGLVLQVLEAVGFAHAQQVLHRDLKPSNILVTPAGQAMLLDFGIAKLLVDGVAQETELTERWGRALTPAYASPEQRLGRGVTVRSDLYAVGVILYELLSGRRPPPADERRDPLPPPSQALQPDSVVAQAEGGALPLARRLARDFDDLVMQALALDPDRRPPDAATLADALRAARQGWPARAGSERLRHGVRRLAARQGAALATSAALWLLLALPAPVHGLLGQIEAWLRPAVPEAQRVVLVTIGPDDHRRLFGGRRPLDPAVLQRLVQRVLDGQPQRVAVDVDTSAPAFAALPAALGAAALQRLTWARDLAAADGGAPRPRPVLGTAEPAPGVQAALAVMPADRDGGALRWYAPALDTAQGRWPTLGAALAGRRDGGVQLRAIPFAATGRLELPASAVLADGFDWAGRIRGRRVLLGGRYDPGDEHPTPLGLQAGIDVVAQVAEAEAAGGGYRRPGIGLRLLLGAGAALLAVGAADRLGRRRGAAAAAALGALMSLAWGLADASAPWPYLLLPALCAPLAVLLAPARRGGG
ncbi:MAG: protein kinase [Rubrivivax sp.]